ncbi:hypothetical protein QER90_004501 [Salmonella enterica]|nr:hypothetical protein [Salmonella enterica]
METTQTRTYLAVPHDEKDEARKAAGKLENNKSALRFDDERKVWYALPGADMEALKRWKPDPLLTGVSAGDALTQFTDFLHANGADVPDKVIMDGTRQRIRMRDDKPGKKSCTYVGHLDGLPNGWFNDFRDGGKDELSTWYFSGEEGDPVASLHMKAVTAQSQWDRAEAKRVLQDKKAGNVRYVHGKFGQAGHQHPYLVKKGVQAARGVHIDDKQRLLIPLQNVDGVIRSMQTIDPEGNKRLTKDAEKSGNFFVVGGTLKNGRPIVCAEGYATAASGAMALRMPVVMAIDSGNLVKVAERLHQKYPDSPMLFLGDDDPPKPHRPGNPGKEAAEKAARLTGGIAVLPSLTPEEKAQGLTDFNDLHQSRGLAALTEELAPLRQKLLSAPTPDASPELQPTETVIMNEPDSVNNEPAARDDEISQMAAYEDWMASGQDTPADPVLPESVPAVHAAAESVAAVNAAPETPSPDTTVGASPTAPAKKARRTKKTAPAEAKEKGSAKPATAPKKPRQKKVTTDDKPEKPQQAAPAAADSQSATRADPTPSLSSLLKQESPPASPIPAPEDEENQPVTPSMNESAPPLRKADTSGTDENGTPDNDAPAPVPMNASHDEASAGLTGTLLEHGAAPYNFRKDESHSYYARLRTAEGERVVWGIGLRAAIADAGLNTSDLVTLQMTGKETVTVDVKQKGEDGKPLLDGKGQPIYRKEERERNKWIARQAIDPTVVNADTRSMTPPGELLAYSLKDWNTLQAGVEELAKKAGVSLPDWPGLPDALWMEPAGKGVPSPDRRPDNPALPAPSRDAGKALFQAMDAEQQLKLLLVKAHGDYVQGVVLHDDVYKPVLGRLCKNARGAPHMTLNEITPDGLKPLGYGNPINNDTGSFNDYVFRLNNEPQRLYAQGLEPEKRPAALQQQLGFDSAPVAPDQLVVRREPESGHRHTPTMPRPGH